MVLSAELILRRDSRVGLLLKKFEVQSAGDSSFLEALHELISENLETICATPSSCIHTAVAIAVFTTVLESQTLYNELFFDTSLEVGKTLSKKERDDKNLAQEKVCDAFCACGLALYHKLDSVHAW